MTRQTSASNCTAQTLSLDTEAERKLREVLHELDRNAYVPQHGVTFADYLRKQWLPAVAGSLRPSTQAGYRNELEIEYHSSPEGHPTTAIDRTAAERSVRPPVEQRA
jgi:hypothetical protein